MRKRIRPSLDRMAVWLVVVLSASAAYLYAFPAPNLFYAAIVLLHVLVGLVATVLLLVWLSGAFRKLRTVGRIGWGAIVVGAIVGCVLVVIGTARPQHRWLYSHIFISLFGVVFLAAAWLSSRIRLGRVPATALALSLCFVAAFAVAYAADWSRNDRWHNAHRIANPAVPPASMDGEGDGPEGPFFPSSAQVKGDIKIPGKFFMQSQACERCHQDVYKQWFGSAHRFSSFNNQWYRKSIEYMQEVVGTRPSKWCGGCHDPAVLYSGMMDTPIKEIVNTPEAQAGLGCVMCHSIAKVKSTMGQGDFVLEYPRLHELAASENPIVRALHDFSVRLNPEPHRRVFLKPFMRTQSAEFCSSCHKVHLDVPVNHYRWIRGFNEYDNWQASGVSGEGARSFYYPPRPLDCADCHMPQVASKDAGNINGTVHSHSFAAANTALPTANEDSQQLDAVKQFLKGSVTVDIFALSPALPRAEVGASAQRPELSTTFAVGEEAEASLPDGATTEVLPIIAPLDRVQGVVRRGDDVLVDVVVRTRRVGHFFPGGTVDAYDTWVELKATDDKNQTIFWSGMVEDNGKGPVERGAHFYRSLLIDGHGNPINKRNAWAARAVVYVRLIPPGAADTVHYRLHIPENAGKKIKLHARLCYRKFTWWNTQFSFAGVPDPKQITSQVAPGYDDTRYVFTGDTSTVSGRLRRIPDLPIISISESEVTLDVAPNTAKPQPARAVLDAEDWTRWNDYGIGLLLQGDLRGAQRAFEKITEIDETNVDGWVNLGRVAVQEGDTARARQVLERALQLKPDLARANFFFAKVLRNEGRYDEAVQRLRLVLSQYPRDRVVINDLGRLLFLQRKYEEAVSEIKRVLAIDPEDLQAHYNLMLSYQGLGRDDLAQQHQKLYLRFKADESAQTLTGEYRRKHPEDNNERQPIHEHVSADLSKLNKKSALPAKVRSDENSAGITPSSKGDGSQAAASSGGAQR
ncbi:MAG TPA: tetratricopeptide repeat protein [Terriglobales bacterium]|nr:tetratricopeptide repeat protein [Terriglobales bacterium]